MRATASRQDPTCARRLAGLSQWQYLARRHRALNEAAAQHARLTLWRIIEHAGLARGDAVLAGDEIDLDAVSAPAQPSGLWRPGRSHLDENLVPARAQCSVDRAIAQPIDVTQLHAAGTQGFARSNHHATSLRIEPHHVERVAGGDAEPAALADGEMDD